MLHGLEGARNCGLGPVAFGRLRAALPSEVDPLAHNTLENVPPALVLVCSYRAVVPVLSGPVSLVSISQWP